MRQHEHPDDGTRRARRRTAARRRRQDDYLDQFDYLDDDGTHWHQHDQYPYLYQQQHEQRA